MDIAHGAFASIVTIVLLSGCSPIGLGVAVTSDAAVLGAASWDPGVGYRSVQSNFAEERGVDVSLFPYNWNGARDPKYFSVAVDFTSDLKSSRRIEVDFRRFMLSLPDGSVIPPIGYGLTYPDVVSQGCRYGSGANSLPPSKARTPYEVRPFPSAPIRIRSNPWSMVSECYDLVFSVASLSPKAAFSINVAGVFIDGAPMHEERVYFIQGAGR